MGRLLELGLSDWALEYMHEHVLDGPQRTPSRNEATAVDRLWKLAGPDGVELTLAAREYGNGERAYVATERHASPERFNVLIDRVRLGIEPSGGGRECALRTVALKDGGQHANLVDAGWDVLDRCAGFDVRAWLLELGASAVGTKQEVLGEAGKTRNRLWLKVPAEGEAPVLWGAYLATRVFPVWKEYSRG